MNKDDLTQEVGWQGGLPGVLLVVLGHLGIWER